MRERLGEVSASMDADPDSVPAHLAALKSLRVIFADAKRTNRVHVFFSCGAYELLARVLGCGTLEHNGALMQKACEIVKEFAQTRDPHLLKEDVRKQLVQLLTRVEECHAYSDAAIFAANVKADVQRWLHV